MDGDGFDDLWSSQPSASGPACAGLDLNSQAPAADEFPGLRLYRDFLQGDDVEVLPRRGRGSGLPPYRPPRARAGDAWATPAPQHAGQLLFGGSSSAAAGRGGGNGGGYTGRSSSGVGGGVWQCANSAVAAAGRRPQRSNTASLGSSGQGIPLPRAPRAPRAPRSGVRGQASGSGAPFNIDDEAMEDDVEELASSGGPPVSHASRAQ
jgi:hypothetical protein